MDLAYSGTHLNDRKHVVVSVKDVHAVCEDEDTGFVPWEWLVVQQR